MIGVMFEILQWLIIVILYWTVSRLADTNVSMLDVIRDVFKDVYDALDNKEDKK